MATRQPLRRILGIDPGSRVTGYGLIDSDETDVYGTNPAVADTDGGGFFGAEALDRARITHIS